MTRDEANLIVERVGVLPILVDALVGLGVLELDHQSDLAESLFMKLISADVVSLPVLRDTLKTLKLKLVRE